jgi:hypothetical protein
MVLIVCWFGTKCQTEKYAIALPRASVSFSIIRFDQYFGKFWIANSRIMVPGQYAGTGQHSLQTQNLNSIVRTRDLANPGFFGDLSLPNPKLVETGFLATYAWAMKQSEVLIG